MKLATAARNGAVNGVTALLDTGSYLQIRTGAPPTNVADADSGTLLATHALASDAFGDASGGTAAADTIADDTDVDANGDPGHFRVKNSSDETIFQGTAGTSGADCIVSVASYTAGGTSHVVSLTLTQPIGS